MASSGSELQETRSRTAVALVGAGTVGAGLGQNGGGGAAGGSGAAAVNDDAARGQRVLLQRSAGGAAGGDGARLLPGEFPCAGLGQPYCRPLCKHEPMPKIVP